MESYLKLIIFIVSLAALFFLLITWIKNKLSQHRLEKEQEEMMRIDSNSQFTLSSRHPDENPPCRESGDPTELLILSIMAKPGQDFGSYDLLQVISAVGLKFGKMNIFHYESGEKTLFSLVSVKEPGDFNLDKIGNFSCPGLMLFMHLNSAENLREIFDLMFLTAENLVEELDGVLYADPKTPWSETIAEQYYLKIEKCESVGIE